MSSSLPSFPSFSDDEDDDENVPLLRRQRQIRGLDSDSIIDPEEIMFVDHDVLGLIHIDENGRVIDDRVVYERWYSSRRIWNGTKWVLRGIGKGIELITPPILYEGAKWLGRQLINGSIFVKNGVVSIYNADISQMVQQTVVDKLNWMWNGIKFYSGQAKEKAMAAIGKIGEVMIASPGAIRDGFQWMWNGVGKDFQLIFYGC